MKVGGFADALHGGEDFGVDASDENVVAGGFLFEHGAGDPGDLLRSFALPEDDFGEALTQRAMMVDFGEAQIFKRKMLEALEGSAAGQFPALHRLQNFQKILMIHSI